MKESIYVMLKDLLITAIGGIILFQFIGISLDSIITLLIKVYVGIEMIRIFNNNRVRIIWKTIIISFLLILGMYGTKYFDFDGSDVRSFLTLNGFLLAGLVLKKQREILNGSDVDDSEANK